MSHGPWKYERPEKPGMYYVNIGDVVTLNSLSVQKFDWKLDETGEPYLVDEVGYPVDGYQNNCKYSEIYIDALNKE